MTTLKQLRYLDALRQTGHFGRAAALVGVTQPALSVQISGLEDRLGVQLVERLPGGARLTQTGAEIAERAGRVLADVSEIEAFARSRTGSLAGPVRLGIIPSIAPYLLPRLLPALGARYPEAELTVRETLTEHLMRELVAGTLDLIVASLPLDHPLIETAVAYEESFVLVGAPDGPDGDDTLALGSLQPERLLLLEDGHCLRDQVLQACGTSLRSSLPAGGVTNLATLVELVANGQGVTLIPERFAASGAVDTARVSTQRFSNPQPQRSVALAWRRTHPQAEQFRGVAETLADCMRDI